MPERDCPSGPWTGFYRYRHLPGTCKTDLILTFENGRITGEGNDIVGPFVISGSYDAASKECYWTKTYVAAHDVFYKGFREDKGIWGLWEIGEHWRGGFHVWPRGSKGAGNEVDSQAEELPAEIVTVGPAQSPQIGSVWNQRACPAICRLP